jgi:uncharacterized NAD(P)/FAD-binding protein YdhS
MYDVVLVGGGVSSLSVMLRLAQQRTLRPGSRLAVVDTDGETGGGVAYGRHVHPAFLLNDRITKIDRTGLGLGAWLVENAAGVLDRLSRYDDVRVRRWIRCYGAQLLQGDVAELYVPRAVFGRFARLQFEQARRRLVEQGVAVDVVTATLQDMTKTHTGWELHVTPSATLHALSVVLGIGGPVADAASAHPRYVAGHPGMDLPAAERVVLQASGGDVLLLGSAASAVEIVYCVEGNPDLRSAFRRVVAISPSGRLPDGLGSPSAPPFVADALLRDSNSADDLMADLAADVQTARHAGLGLPDAYQALHAAFVTRFRRMDATEKKRVTDLHVPTYLTLMRKTSTVYASGARRLLAREQLVYVPGRVAAVSTVGNEVHVTLQDGRSLRGAVALDCRGFGKAVRNPLLGRLMTAGVVETNDSNMGGIRVNTRLEAAPGLVVLGPLLAGTPRTGDHIWHLEDIPRIYEIAEDVVRTLRDVVAASWQADSLISLPVAQTHRDGAVAALAGGHLAG